MSDPTLATLFAFDGGHATERQLQVVGARSSQTADRSVLPGAPSRSFWSTVAGAVAQALDEALHVKVTDVLAGGWNTLHKLLEAGEQSRNSPGKALRVSLAQHTITSSHHPHVELLVGGRKVADVPFDVELELEIEGAIITVQDARIKEASLGKCTGKGTLKCAGSLLAERRTQEIGLPGKITFGDGITIPNTAC